MDANRTYSLGFVSFRQHRELSAYYPWEKVLALYTLLLMVAGTLGNLVTFTIMMRKSLRKYSCMRYLAVLSLADLVVLYQWNLNSFYKYYLTRPPEYTDLEELSVFWCRWISYFAFTSLQLSSWLLATVSIDRLMLLHSSWWKRHMTKPRTVNFIIATIIGTVFALNSHILVLNGFETNKTNEHNLTQTVVECYRSREDKNYIFPKWERVHLLVYNVLPFSIMCVCNSLIIYSVKFANNQIRSSRKADQKKRRLTYMLVLVTCSFMCLTLPSVIFHTFFREAMRGKPHRRILNLFLNNLLHTSHAINFVLYVLSAPIFRNEVKSMCACATQWRASSNQPTEADWENDDEDGSGGDDDDHNRDPSRSQPEQLHLSPK
nr:G protein-coupled receptor [Proales similis]